VANTRRGRTVLVCSRSPRAWRSSVRPPFPLPTPVHSLLVALVRSAKLPEYRRSPHRALHRTTAPLTKLLAPIASSCFALPSPPLVGSIEPQIGRKRHIHHRRLHRRAAERGAAMAVDVCSSSVPSSPCLVLLVGRIWCKYNPLRLYRRGVAGTDVSSCAIRHGRRRRHPRFSRARSSFCPCSLRIACPRAAIAFLRDVTTVRNSVVEERHDPVILPSPPPPLPAVSRRELPLWSV
jgi:hypothetical protein